MELVDKFKRLNAWPSLSNFPFPMKALIGSIRKQYMELILFPKLKLDLSGSVAQSIYTPQSPIYSIFIIFQL